MALDPLAADLLPLAAAARALPPLRDGRRVSPSTLWRRAAHGLRGVRLEIVRLGGTACTTREALRRFLREAEAARLRPDETPAPVPTASTPAAAAGEELAALGI
jgi:hypothetical protein